MNEKRTVEEAKRGDPEAIRLVVEAYYSSVLRFMTTLCANPADAEDLTQEAFVQALRSLRKFRGESGMRTWLHRIAYHGYLRSRRRGAARVAPLRISYHSPLFESSSLLGARS